MKYKICLISLGCDKNLVDSEKMLGLLSEKGYGFTDAPEEADICIINTCCFINDAKEESIQNILDIAELKKEGWLQALVVTGCLAQRYADEIRKEIPEVDAVIGANAYDGIVTVLEQVLQEEKPVYLRESGYLPGAKAKRCISSGYTAYLKIAEGCAKCCTYCIIPKIRGPYRSYPMEDLIAEARTLAAQGVKELILVAQETTLYGTDLYGKKMLPALLEALSQIDGFVWIRLLYCYPEEITDALIETIRDNKKICHYLDIPMQHCNDGILKRMGRKTDKASLTALVEKLRKEIPDIVLRTTFITGFPGESEAAFEELADFVDEMAFDRVGVFCYSPEEDTPACTFPDQVPEAEKERRRDVLMELQQEISLEKGQEQIGRTLSVVIEGELPEEMVYVGRSYRDAPEVDGYVFVETTERLMSGDFAEVTIRDASEYDLTGEIKNEFTE